MNEQDSARTSNRIAVIGMSGRYPGGDTPDLLWQTLKSGKDAVTEARGDRWDLGWHHPDARREGRVYTRAGGFLDRIDCFDADFFGLSPRETRQVDPQQRLLLELAWEAHEDAGIAPRSRAGSTTGVFVGISSNDYSNLNGQAWPDAYSNTGSSFSIAANRISYIFDFHGPSVALDTACSSSIVCLHQACMSLLAGECSAALAGGVSLLVHFRPWLGFARASMLSPTGRCKSFDASGDGYVRSEGGGLVLLKRLADAEADGDRILGVIVGSGVNSDGRTMGLSMPNGAAQEDLLRKVYTQSNVPAEDVFYVEAHGTGTAVGDPIECGALGRVFGEFRAEESRCLIGSVKSNIGHLEAASGIAGLAKVLLALKHREIPANLHFKTPNPKIEFEKWKLEVVTQTTPLPQQEKPVVIGINSFGFGGTNAHAILEEYLRRTSSTANAAALAGPAVMVMSGHTEAALKALAQRYLELLRDGDQVPTWSELCAAVASTRSPQRHRLAILASDRAEAAKKLEAFLADRPCAGSAAGTSMAPATRIAFVYSGNGPQWWGMGRELLESDKIFAATIDAIDAIFEPLAGWSLRAEMNRPEADSRIALTEIAQPLLFALQLGLTRVMAAAGIHPCAVLGHSVGEVAAACASGALSLEQATQVIFHRSMQQSTTAGMGRMAALGVSPDEARAAMASIPGWLELAATNSSRAVTVAGDSAALDQLVTAMTAEGKFARALALNYPFHTQAMDSIRDGLTAALGDLKPSAAAIPFISTVTGSPLEGGGLDAEYWFRNVREPVMFHQAVTHMVKELGYTLFVELGPHPVLKDYVQQSARAADCTVTTLQTLRRPGAKGPEPEADNLANALCACLAHGGADPQRLYARPQRLIELPLYPWQHVRHWRGGCAMPDVTVPTQREHPLLGYRVHCAEPTWQNALDTNQLPYLNDHVVQNAVLFPAAGYSEIALSAAQRLLGRGTLDVENFEILRPLTLSPFSDPIVQLSADVKDGTFEIRSKAEVFSEEWTSHVRGRLSRLETAPTPARDLVQIAARMPEEMSFEQHYHHAAARGLDYGPQFQGVTRVRLSAPDAPVREALADISIAALDVAGLGEYLAHPALLDCCIQVLISLIAQTDTQNCCMIPVQFGRLRSVAPLTNQMLCHTTILRESERTALAQFCVMDTAGNPLLFIEEARCQKVDFRQAHTSPLISEWWRLDCAAPVLAQPPSAPPLHRIAGAVREALDCVVQSSHRDLFYRDVHPQLERLAGIYAANVLTELNEGTADFDFPALMRKGGVKRDQALLLKKLIGMCEQDGAISQASATTWHWADRPPVQPDTPWRELLLAHPNYQAELLVLAHAGANLANRLRGAQESTDAQSLYDQLGDTAPFQAPYNRMVRAIVEGLMAQWPSNRPIRILDLGSGAGGMAAWLLPVLSPERTEYVFADPSEAAVARAEHRFAAHRFARFVVLDMDRDLIEPDQAARHYDLVIGSNVLGRSEDLLERIQQVMSPDGQLLMIQLNPDRFSDLAFNARSASWSDELEASGFEDVIAIADTMACPAGQQTQQSIWMARMPRTATRSAPAAVAALAVRRWLVVVEPGERASEFTLAVAAGLQAHGQTVTLRAFDGEESELQSTAASAVAEFLPEEIVFIAGGDLTQHLLATETRRCLTVVSLVQGVDGTQATAPKLTLVTRGAWHTAMKDGPLDPAQAPLWGLGRVIGNEHPSLEPHMIDLHSNLNAAEDGAWLTAELLRRDAETEVQLLAGMRFVNRQRVNTLTDLARHSGRASPCFALDFTAQGGLDSLYLRERARRTPGGDEIEIAVKAAGLNFRDVLWTMGMLPEEAVENGFSGPTIGMECAGEVVRVGAAVTNFNPGDRVVAFASSCFGTHVTTSAGSAARIPEGIDYAAAATIPTAFLTAYYALDHLARIQPGETVLIHGAAGGVGLAAIQIAKLKGAKVIGTAGSARKRRMLKMLGVDHALSSRSLDFADEVKQLTGGTGVDIVLNSLAGEAITKSLQCLRPFGRFLEIGKRDLYANSRIGLRPFRQNLSYFGIDADTLLVERGDLARSVFAAVIAHFARGELRPLPFQAIPISRAAEAFRAMQQSRHVGKLIVSLESDVLESLPVVPAGRSVRPDVTYLVTGGLGGFGLATAEWLVEQGATSLALLSRRGAASEEASAGLARLSQAGATVRPFACDIADPASLLAVLETVRQEMRPLVGIIHSAAVIDDAPVAKLQREQLLTNFGAKLQGAWNLHDATRQDAIEMFVLYSSSAAGVGNPGQAAYVAANMYLDSLAQYRRANGLAALSIGWGAIKDAGFLTRHEAVAGMLKNRTGLDATPSREALQDFARLTAVGATRVSVGRFDFYRLAQMLPGARVPRFLAVIPKGAAAGFQAQETLVSLIAKTPEGERRHFVVERMREHGARVLGTSPSQINIEQPLSELGLDSLMAVELSVAIERDLGRPISVMQLLSAGSLSAIADLVLNMLQAGADAGPPALPPEPPPAATLATAREAPQSVNA